MQRLNCEGFTLFFPAEETISAATIREMCTDSIIQIRHSWDLPLPVNLYVYVMTSWQQFAFRSVPLPLLPLLLITSPFWISRIKNLWLYAGGWAQNYGFRQAIGIKPPRLLRQAQNNLGQRIFVQNSNIEEKLRNICCHELTHAFTAPLKLPRWLNEGLAMVTVDRLLGKATVQKETRSTLKGTAGRPLSGRIRKISSQNQEEVVSFYTRGYWIVRYLEETHPGLLKQLLMKPCHRLEYEKEMAAALHLAHPQFAKKINGLVLSHHW